MDVWQIVILLIAAYVAITSLLRIIANRRNSLISDMRSQIEAERERREQAERRARAKEKKKRRKKEPS